MRNNRRRKTRYADGGAADFSDPSGATPYVPPADAAPESPPMPYGEQMSRTFSGAGGLTAGALRGTAAGMAGVPRDFGDFVADAGHALSRERSPLVWSPEAWQKGFAALKHGVDVTLPSDKELLNNPHFLPKLRPDAIAERMPYDDMRPMMEKGADAAQEGGTYAGMLLGPQIGRAAEFAGRAAHKARTAIPEHLRAAAEDYARRRGTSFSAAADKLGEWWRTYAPQAGAAVDTPLVFTGQALPTEYKAPAYAAGGPVHMTDAGFAAHAAPTSSDPVIAHLMRHAPHTSHSAVAAPLRYKKGGAVDWEATARAHFDDLMRAHESAEAHREYLAHNEDKE